jgi:hypothetical protein
MWKGQKHELICFPREDLPVKYIKVMVSFFIKITLKNKVMVYNYLLIFLKILLEIIIKNFVL